MITGNRSVYYIRKYTTLGLYDRIGKRPKLSFLIVIPEKGAP